MRVWEKETLLNFYATMRTCLVHIRYFTFKLNHEQSLCFGEHRHASQKTVGEKNLMSASAARVPRDSPT